MALSAVRTHSEKVVVFKSGGEPSPGTEPAGTFIVDFQL